MVCMCVCVCLYICVCVHLCVCVCACVRASVRACVRAPALRIVSMDKIFRFTNQLIIIITLAPTRDVVDRSSRL